MTRALAILTLLLAVAFAGAPFVTSPFTGFEADQLPIPQIDPPVQPAGYAFGIWGLIYGWLILSGGYGLWKRAEASDWTRARPWLAVSLAVGVPWLAIANASAIWASITIVVMAATAIAALVLSPARDTWFFRFPVGLYAGWLTAASFVSIATTMAGYGILLGAAGWAVIGILGAFLTAALVLTTERAGPAYPAAVIWALVGIMVANGASTLSALAFAGAVALAALAVLRAGFPKVFS